MMGAIAGTVSLLLGTSPLTNLGTLNPGWRLAVAAVSGLTGLAALGVAFSYAVRVLEARLFDINGLAKAPDMAWLRTLLNELLEARFPPGIHNIEELSARFFAVRQRVFDPHRPPPGDLAYHSSDDKEFQDLRRHVDIVLLIAAYEMARHLFARFCRVLGGMGAVAAIALLVFAWAANPPKPADNPPKPADNNLASSGQPQKVLIEFAPQNQVCTSPGFCCGASAACRKTSPANATLPEDCVAFSVKDGQATCISQAVDPGKLRDQGRLFVQLPRSRAPIDVSGLVTDAISSLSGTGATISPASLAKTIADNLTKSFSSEFGKQLADHLFSAGNPHQTGRSGSADPDTKIEIHFVTSAVRAPHNQTWRRSVELFPFPTGKASVKDPGAWLRELAALAAEAQPEDCAIEISGFADHRGNPAFNLNLSMERASYIERLLLQLGATRGRITLHANGQFTTACETGQADDLACNRAVVATVVCHNSGLD